MAAFLYISGAGLRHTIAAKDICTPKQRFIYLRRLRYQQGTDTPLRKTDAASLCEQLVFYQYPEGNK